ncbi:MAG TPA: hypothetical protein PL140_09145, partial [Ferrovaceae bacterium]|nr:hypothetical protein [Ferrovaceae bacterium]
MSNPNSQLTTNLVPVQAIFDPNGNIVSLVGPGGEYFSPPISSDTIVNSTIDSSPIGQTTPSTGAFTSLLASGNTQLQTLSATATTVNSLTINGTLTVGGSIGTMGQFLQSTGTGVQWITASIYGVNITDDTTSATVHYPTLVTNTTGTTTQEYTSSTKLQFTPSTGTLYSTIGNFGTLQTANAAITGGSITGVSITLESINNTPIGSTTPSTGVFTTLTDSGLSMGQVTFAGTGG